MNGVLVHNTINWQTIYTGNQMQTSLQMEILNDKQLQWLQTQLKNYLESSTSTNKHKVNNQDGNIVVTPMDDDPIVRNFKIQIQNRTNEIVSWFNQRYYQNVQTNPIIK